MHCGIGFSCKLYLKSTVIGKHLESNWQSAYYNIVQIHECDSLMSFISQASSIFHKLTNSVVQCVIIKFKLSVSWLRNFQRFM